MERRLRGFFWAFAGVAALVLLAPVSLGGSQAPFSPDKIYHFVAFYLLTVAFLLGTGFRGRGFAFVLAASLALAIETVQDLIPWREASAADFAVGALGALAGALTPKRGVDLVMKALASGFGLGYMPKAPGTWASAATALALYFWPHEPGEPLVYLLIVWVLATWSASYVQPLWGEDPRQVVADEALGTLAALLWLPKTAATYLVATALFRLFDIFKPPFVRWAEELPGGSGVALDDLLAGLLANYITFLLVWLTPLTKVSLLEIVKFLLS